MTPFWPTLDPYREGVSSPKNLSKHSLTIPGQTENSYSPPNEFQNDNEETTNQGYQLWTG